MKEMHIELFHLNTEWKDRQCKM